ncbi:Cell division control protein 6 homolog [Linum perenne]
MPSLAALTVSQSGQESLTTPQKRRLRSNSTSSAPETPTPTPTPICVSTKRKSPRRCLDCSPNSSETRSDSIEGLSGELEERLNWNPRDTAQVSAVKEALHVSTAPATVVCREDEQRRVFDFCKECVEKEQSGSLYVCGCPGTGKSLSMEKVSNRLIEWAKNGDVQSPEVLSINCTALTSSSQIFSKIADKVSMKTKMKGTTTPLQHLQKLYSQPQQSTGIHCRLIIADELDYLITKDRAVLHDLFMLTTLPFSRCILIGIANAIDLADRFLPKLQSLNCKPLVITFKAYSKDQILRILQERLIKVAAASGDMRKALSVCRSAVEILEADVRDSTDDMNPESSVDKQEKSIVSHSCDYINALNFMQVKVDHMAAALSKAFASPLVDTIQSLPQHQQIILCSAVKFFRGGKKDTIVGELNKSYVETCKSRKIPPVSISEFLSMCRVLHDQGLVKLGQSRDDKSKRVTLIVDEADISFALQGVRFFRNCLE